MSTPNKFEDGDLRMTHPPTRKFAISKDVALQEIPRAISINVSGNVDIEMEDGSRGVSYLIAGVQHSMRCIKIHSAGTAAGITEITGWA